MAFWNRKKREQQEDNQRLEQEAMERLAQIRSQKRDERADFGKSEAADAEASRNINTEEYRPEVVKPVYKDDRKRYVTECCQAIQAADNQIAKIREEYQDVTDALLDTQRIDRISGDERTALTNAARNIFKLTKERNQYKNRNLSIPDAVLRRFEPYEENLTDEIKKMYNAETYQKALDGDLDKLHEEKKKLRREKQEIIEKQNSLKGMAKVLIVLIVSLFVLFVVIYYAMGIDMTFPYLGTILLAAISSTVIFIESNRNRRDMTLADRKMDKAISLLNRVKINCVNNLNLLDYNRQKYGVANAMQFEQYWTEYMKAKEYERKFRENTEQLNYYCESLVELLKEHAVQEPEIWTSQVIALIDDREMVEIRHKLNTRRQLLREQVEYNESVKKGFVEGIDELLRENPDNKKELISIVEKFNEEA